MENYGNLFLIVLEKVYFFHNTKKFLFFLKNNCEKT